jgi:multidrug efflux pump subunit AcrB
MDAIKEASDLSIRRACGFGLLAIWTTMVGLSYEPLLAVRAGAVLMTVMGAVLLVRAWGARHRPYKRTEVWLILNKTHDLPEARAQQVFGNILRERYLWHATAAGWIALVLWGVGIFLALFGRGSLPE